MDLQFPHHESEIAQSTICNKEIPARYWLHNNMITVNGRKMGKSYGNQIKLTEMFAGTHPLLQQAYSPMTIRFFILQTHYRSTLDFGNEALQAAEKGMRRLWEAYEVLKKLGPVAPAASANGSSPASPAAEDPELDKKVNVLLAELDEFMNDDFNTAKVLANLFELAPVINSLRSGQISPGAISGETLRSLQAYFKSYLEDILGLKDGAGAGDQKLDGVVELLIDIRKDARAKKDYAASDKIRKQLLELGIVLKDEKDGGVSYSFS
jgi:cysteinyl-tRNA synthetase